MSTWPPTRPPLPGEPPRTPWQPESRPSPAVAPPSTTVNVQRDWLGERLLDARIVSLSGKLTPDAANRGAASLALLDASGDDPIQLRFCDLTPDTRTELDTALTLLDTLDLVGVPVHATCLGGLTGATVVLLAVADRRSAGTNTVLTLREPRAQFDGPTGDVTARAEQYERQLRLLQQRLADACHRPVDTVIDDMRAGRILTAEQARDYGLLDTVTSDRQ